MANKIEIQDRLNKANLSKKQKKILSSIFEDLLIMYSKYDLSRGDRNADWYFHGLVDAYNSACKVIDGVEDDYLYDLPEEAALPQTPYPGRCKRIAKQAFQEAFDPADAPAGYDWEGDFEKWWNENNS